MADSLKVFRGKPYQVNSQIEIRQPTLDEIAEYGEKEYLQLVRAICSTPADRKVEIWDSLHVYWDQVDEYELFLSMFNLFRNLDMSILFGDLDFTTFETIATPTNLKTVEFAVRNKDGVLVDRAIHKDLTEYVRKLHRLKKNVDVGVNKVTKDVMIEDDRDEMLLASRKPFDSLFLPLISSLTNCPEFKYRWDDVWTLPIGVFMDSVERVQKHKNFTFVMHGVYNGCVDMKKINKKQLNWMDSLT